MDFDKNKFVFKEIFLNSNGKTSGSGFIGVIGSLTVILCLILCMIGYIIGRDHTVEVLTSIVLLSGIYTALLATRKIVKEKDDKN